MFTLCNITYSKLNCSVLALHRQDQSWYFSPQHSIAVYDSHSRPLMTSKLSPKHAPQQNHSYSHLTCYMRNWKLLLVLPPMLLRNWKSLLPSLFMQIKMTLGVNLKDLTTEKSRALKDHRDSAGSMVLTILYLHYLSPSPSLLFSLPPSLALFSLSFPLPLSPIQLILQNKVGIAEPTFGLFCTLIWAEDF